MIDGNELPEPVNGVITLTEDVYLTAPLEVKAGDALIIDGQGEYRIRPVEGGGFSEMLLLKFLAVN